LILELPKSQEEHCWANLSFLLLLLLLQVLVQVKQVAGRTVQEQLVMNGAAVNLLPA
jgi:hypothetical protein